MRSAKTLITICPSCMRGVHTCFSYSSLKVISPYRLASPTNPLSPLAISFSTITLLNPSYSLSLSLSLSLDLSYVLSAYLSLSFYLSSFSLSLFSCLPLLN